MLRRAFLALVAGLFAAETLAQSGITPQRKPRVGLRAPEPEKPAAKPATETKPQAAQGNAADEDSPGVRAVEEIFTCLAAGLPKEWRRAWAVVTDVGGDGRERSFDGRFFYSLEADGSKPLALVPCSAEDAARRVHALNDFLEFDKRNWKTCTLTFSSEGKFDLKYDYEQ